MTPEEMVFIENLFRSLERQMKRGFSRYDEALEHATVDAGMLARHDRLVADHEDWLRNHTLAVAKHEQMMEQIDQKLDRLADLILKGRGTNGKE